MKLLMVGLSKKVPLPSGLIQMWDSKDVVEIEAGAFTFVLNPRYSSARLGQRLAKILCDDEENEVECGETEKARRDAIAPQKAEFQENKNRSKSKSSAEPTKGAIQRENQKSG